MASKKQAVKREVTILARYTVMVDHTMQDGTFYKAGTIVLWVENDKGDRYYVTLRRTGQHSCTCPHVPSKKSPACYHLTQCRQVENDRAAKANEVIRQAQRDSETLSRQLAEQKAPEVVPGTLHNARPFNFMR